MSVYTTNNKLKKALGTMQGSTISVGSVTLFVVILMIFFAILPAYKSITDQVKNNEAKTKYYNDLVQKKTSLDKLAQSYETNKTIIDFFNLYTTSTPDTEVMTANLDKIAKGNNFVLTSITILDTTGTTSKDSPFINYSNITVKAINLTFEGPLEKTSILLNDLEKFPISINDSTFRISQKKNTGANANTAKQSFIQNNIVQISISGEFYFWNSN